MPHVTLGTELYRTGLHKISVETLRYTDAHKAFIREVAAHPDWFHENPKDEGTQVLDFTLAPQDRELAHGFVDLLFDSGIIRAVHDVLGRPFYLANFMHMRTPPGAPALGWHRDCYFDKKGSPVGPIPPAVKITILHGDVNMDAAPFECVPGSHRVDFQSRRFDRVYTALSRRRHFTFTGREGDVLLFDTSILHRRRAALSGQARTATIFALVGSPIQLEGFIPNHRSEIAHFIKRGTEFGLYDSVPSKLLSHNLGRQDLAKSLSTQDVQM